MSRAIRPLPPNHPLQHMTVTQWWALGRPTTAAEEAEALARLGLTLDALAGADDDSEDEDSSASPADALETAPAASTFSTNDPEEARWSGKGIEDYVRGLNGESE